MAAWYDPDLWYAKGPQPYHAQPGVALAAMKNAQEQAMQQTILPAKLKSLELDNQQRLLDIESAINLKQGMAEFAQSYNELSKLPDGWADPKAREVVSRAILKYPELVKSPLFQQAELNIDRASDNKRLLDKLKLDSEHQMRTDQIKVIQAEINAAVAAGNLTAAQSRIQALQDKLNAGTPDMQNVSAQVEDEIKAGKLTPENAAARRAELMGQRTSRPTGSQPDILDLQTARDKARAEGRSQDANEIQLQIEKLNTAPNNRMIRQVLPDGTVVEMPDTGTSSLMPSTRAQFQQKMASIDSLQGEIKGLAERLRPGAIGPIAAARETVSQFAGGVPGGNILEAVVGIGTKDFEQRQAMRELRANAVRAFSDHTGNISDRDQKMIDELLPPTGFKGNVRLAKASLESLRERAARKSLSLGSKLGQVSSWALEAIDARDLDQMVKDKIIDLSTLTPDQLKIIVERNQGLLPIAREELKRRQPVR